MQDTRRSLKALAQVSGLPAPSVSERLRRLEERGVISAYTLEIGPKSFGYPLQAIVRIRPLPGRLQEVERQILAIDEFTQCDKNTDDDCFIARSRYVPWKSWTACRTTSTTTPKPTLRSSRNHRSNDACPPGVSAIPKALAALKKLQRRGQKAPLKSPF